MLEISVNDLITGLMVSANRQSESVVERHNSLGSKHGGASLKKTLPNPETAR